MFQPPLKILQHLSKKCQHLLKKSQRLPKKYQPLPKKFQPHPPEKLLPIFFQLPLKISEPNLKKLQHFYYFFLRLFLHFSKINLNFFTPLYNFMNLVYTLMNFIQNSPKAFNFFTPRTPSLTPAPDSPLLPYMYTTKPKLSWK